MSDNHNLPTPDDDFSNDFLANQEDTNDNSSIYLTGAKILITSFLILLSVVIGIYHCKH